MDSERIKELAVWAGLRFHVSGSPSVAIEFVNGHRRDLDKFAELVNQELATEIDRLREVCATAYIAAGVVGAPERLLDVLSEASCGLELSREPGAILPIGEEEFEGVETAARVAELEEEVERLREALFRIACKLESQIIRNPDLPESCREAMKEAFVLAKGGWIA